LGLGVLFLCALSGWSLLLSLAAEGRLFWPGKVGRQVWLELAGLGGLCVIAAYASLRCGLLALAGEAQGRAPTSPVGAWLCLLAHFKLSFVVLLYSLAFSWWGRVRLVMWLVEPASWPWRPSTHTALHFAAPSLPWMLICLSVAWLPVVPFLASDAWRLLRPLMVPRAARLRVPFAIASVVVALVAVLSVRHHAIALFEMFWFPPDARL
jgi:hypothetical protein